MGVVSTVPTLETQSVISWSTKSSKALIMTFSFALAEDRTYPPQTVEKMGRVDESVWSSRSGGRSEVFALLFSPSPKQG